VLGQATQEKLRHYVESGGHLVLGPRLPSLDERLKPCALLQEIGEPPSSREDRLDLGSGFEVRKADLFGGKTSCRNAHGTGELIQFGFCFPKPPRDGIAQEAASWIAALLAESGIHPTCPSADPAIETALHEADGLPRVLFIANPENDFRETKIQLAAGLSRNWIDAWDESRHQAEGGALRIGVPPYTVRILVEESR
ncbi:MAG: hypothetical protein AB1405_04560, partial [Bdellovibrionota bacterium]